MSFEPREFLQHIRAEAAFLIRQSRELTRAQFEQDEMLQRAFVRSLEVIGEASKKISPAFRAAHPEIEWRAMAGMRDHLIPATSLSTTLSSGMWCIRKFQCYMSAFRTSWPLNSSCPPA